jgi:endonuclease YncB( thermonuclease family)
MKPNAGYTVLKVESGDTVYIDFNNNGVAERDERKGLSDIAAFETRAGYKLNEQMREYNLSEQEVLELGYLAKELLKEKVLNKKVKVKFVGKKRYYVLLYLNDELVQDELIESGYVVPYKYSRRYRDNHRQVEHARELLQGRELRKKHSEQQPKNTEKICEIKKSSFEKIKKSSFEVSTENIDLYFVDPTNNKITTNFCMNMACKSLLNEIQNAKKTIYFAMYGIAEMDEIQNALLEAKARGVEVKGVIDKDLKNKNIYADTPVLVEKLGTENVKDDYLKDDKFLNRDPSAPPNFPQKLKYKVGNKEIVSEFKADFLFDLRKAIMNYKFFIFDN